MARRSRAREVALQLLYQHDQNPHIPRADLEAFVHGRLNHAAAEAFCLALHDGVLREQATIDPRLNEIAENWRLTRMAVVDRNILRLAAYEILFTPETPFRVTLDEAVELAHHYGSGAGSPAFVNGILDRLAKQARPDEAALPA
jgi:N utilization substance protein B